MRVLKAGRVFATSLGLSGLIGLSACVDFQVTDSVPGSQASPPSPEAPVDPAPANLVLTVVKVQAGQILVEGTGLDAVQTAVLRQGGTTSSLVVESKTATSLVLKAASLVSFAAGSVYDLVVASATASASTTFEISITDGSVTPAKLIAGSEGDVLTTVSGLPAWAAPVVSDGLSCPSDMVKVPAANGNRSYCIEKVERELASGMVIREAFRACIVAKRHLCSGAEWVAACESPPTGLTGMTGNYEWVSEAYISADNESPAGPRGIIVGLSGCSDLQVQVPFSDFHRYRCCTR